MLVEKNLNEAVETYTYEEIAKAIGVSRQMVANIEAKALKKLKQALFKRGFDADSLLPA